MLILLSPAKTLNLDKGKLPGNHSLPVFLKDAAVLIETLRQMTPHDISSLMKVSEKLAHLNYERFQAWQLPFTPENAKANIARVIIMYAMFGYQSTSNTRIRVNSKVKVMSAIRKIARFRCFTLVISYYCTM